MRERKNKKKKKKQVEKGRGGQIEGKPEEISIGKEARMRKEEVVRKRLKGGYKNLVGKKSDGEQEQEMREKMREW